MTETGPFYTDVQPGDLVYYNPMDSITIIYEETSSVPTLTKMGEITSDLDVFENLPDNLEMRVRAPVAATTARAVHPGRSERAHCAACPRLGLPMSQHGTVSGSGHRTQA